MYPPFQVRGRKDLLSDQVVVFDTHAEILSGSNSIITLIGKGYASISGNGIGQKTRTLLLREYDKLFSYSDDWNLYNRKTGLCRGYSGGLYPLAAL